MLENEKLPDADIVRGWAFMIMRETEQTTLAFWKCKVPGKRSQAPIEFEIGLHHRHRVEALDPPFGIWPHSSIA